MANTEFRLATVGAHLPGNGGPGALAVTVYAVAKLNHPQSAPYCLANELICAILGRSIGLPLPAFEIAAYGSPPKNYFVSLNFNVSGDTLPPVDTDLCADRIPDLSTGLLLFDILIANLDRHRANFTVDFSTQPVRMRIFDHSHALFGYHPGGGLRRLQDLQTHLGVSWGRATNGQPTQITGPERHCLLNKIQTDEFFDKWVGRIKSIPDFIIEDACDIARGLGITPTESAAALDFLCYRRDNLDAIIHANQRHFTAVPTWSLFRENT